MIICHMIKIVGMIILALGAGTITAAGVFALVTSVGVVNRIAAVTDMRNHLMLFEEMIIAGVVVGNVVFLFDIAVGGGVIVVMAYGLLSGMYVGLFAVCLAETIKALPIFIRKVRVGKGLGWIILCIALGKAFGQMLYCFGLYTD